MANKQTKQLRKLSHKAGIHKVTFFTHTEPRAFGNTSSNPKAKKHEVTVFEYSQGSTAFDPRRKSLKNKQRYRQQKGHGYGQDATNLI